MDQKLSYTINPRIIYENIDGEVIILNLDVGYYYSLHKVAAHIWALLEQNHSTNDIISIVSKYYEQPYEEISDIIENFITELEQEQLIMLLKDQNIKDQNDKQTSLLNKTINNNSCDTLYDTHNSVTRTTTPTIFTQPILEKYTDMEGLLLIDPIHEVDEEGWPHRIPALQHLEEESKTNQNQD